MGTFLIMVGVEVWVRAVGGDRDGDIGGDGGGDGDGVGGPSWDGTSRAGHWAGLRVDRVGVRLVVQNSPAALA